MAETTATCPFCSITSKSELAIQLHIEDSHSENAPMNGVGLYHEPSDASRHNDNIADVHEAAPNEWIKCTRQDCGEYLHLSEVDEHLAFHAAIESSDGERDSDSRPQDLSCASPSASSSKGKENKRSTAQRSDKHQSTQSNLLDYFSGNSYMRKQRKRDLSRPKQPGRLGKRELGPHAFEKEMPTQVRRHLLNDAEPRECNQIDKNGKLQRVLKIDNETANVVPVLADLCALDETTTATYFCNPAIKHIVKIRCDGNFCGYWNIQMLLSYLQQTNTIPDMHKLPNVVQIQETVEQAWRNGICAYGKTETGGITNTRKWIGTHEVVAYFTQTGVSVNPLAFRDEENNKSYDAVSTMLDHVEAYFMGGLDKAELRGNSTITQLPPIYFQRFGHSMTIVGLERKADGSRNLVVFDPSITTSDGIRKLAAGDSTRALTKTLLNPYRRSDLSLRQWDEFEIVVLNLPATK